MKKLIAAAVATSVSAIAMADVSITGNAKYEVFQTEVTGAAATYTANTEVNVSVKGKTGDTSVVANLELNTHGGGTADGTGLDIEDMYMTTKLGDINVKAGSYASGTTALLGEIDAGQRATDKLDLSTNIGDWKVAYSVGESSGGELNNDGSAVSVSGKIAGFNVALKEQSDSYTGFGVSGDIAGIKTRLEMKNGDAANSDVTFGEFSTSLGGATVGYAFVDADAAQLISEGDSGIFGRSLAGDDTGTIPAGDTVTGASQIMISTSVAGNTVTAKIGELKDKIAAGTDADFTELSLKRALASGANLAIIYDDYDSSSSATTQVLEVELNVAF